MKPRLIVGPPGTGKTHTLVDEILKIKPDKFALLTFTRQAANEAKQRLRAYYSDKELKYVRTIHSLAFEQLGLHTNQVFNYNHYLEFGKQFGYDFHGKSYSQEDGTNYGLTEDDVKFRDMQINLLINSEILKDYSLYKHRNNLYDFNDMLLIAKNDYENRLHLDLLLIDEIQDLTSLQLKFIQNIYSKQVIYAGDDDQMIFEWAGVNRKEFKKLSEGCEIETLMYSYRFGKELGNLSNRFRGNRFKEWRIEKRIWNYSWDKVDYVINIPEIDSIYEEIMRSSESWLLLCRNNYFFRYASDYLSWNGISHSLITDYKHTKVKLCTIHASKGLEADNVILFQDVSPATYHNGITDSEHRVWYVGITRARKKLYIVEPRTEYHYSVY